LNPLIAAQTFEYKIWNLLDRLTKSLFGLRYDIAGATFAYRFAALLSGCRGQGPLRSHFDMYNTEVENSFFSNMYLAEARMLCFESSSSKRITAGMSLMSVLHQL